MLLEDSLRVWSRARDMLIADGILQFPAGPSPSSYDAVLMSLLPVQPRKVTLVTLSQSMMTGILSHHGSLDVVNFMVLSAEGAMSSATSTVALSAAASEGEPARKPTKKNTDAAAGGLCTYRNCLYGKFPFLYLQSVDSNEYFRGRDTTGPRITRQSLRMSVAALSGFDVVEALVQATTAHKARRRNSGSRIDSAPAMNTFASAEVSVVVVSVCWPPSCRRAFAPLAALPVLPPTVFLHSAWSSSRVWCTPPAALPQPLGASAARSTPPLLQLSRSRSAWAKAAPC